MATQANLIEVTIWFRGVTEARLARRLANAIASAGAREGKFVQAFDNYADSPDRIDVPCRSYARLCVEPIAEPYIYENHSPSVVIVTEATLLKGCNVLKGLEPGGVLVVNTNRGPEAMLALLQDLPNLHRLKTLATIEVGNVALPYVPYGAGEGAVDTATQLKGAPILLGAFSRASGVVSIESLKAIERDHHGLELGYNETELLENPGYIPEEPTVEVLAEGYRSKVDLVIPAPAPGGENEDMITGNYRQQRPVIDLGKCTLCRMCWISCPDSCIEVPGRSGERIAVNLKYCKGCGVCWSVCPVEGAIRPEPELNYAGDVVRITY
ncbi:MAG: 2-oxoacid:acceptor oxidoreductase family protein [Bacteroidetes bacterium]|nr:2-oxoacid:acceptor oxidoreductase family protein [Bacteroidota bacterium]MCL5025787.1 2-oxoacid:acceptor oxidoreductase family protein [Chloroflexota bacterium]